MALDTGMYQALKGIPQIAGAADLEEQKQKLIGMRQQNEAQGMALEQQRKQQAKSWAMDQALSEAGNDPQKQIDTRLKLGDVKGAHEVVDLAAKQQQVKMQYQDSLMKMDDHAKGMIQSSLSDMGNAASSALSEIEASPDAGPNIWYDKLDKMIARYAPSEGDSPQLRSFKMNMINSLHKEQSSMEDPNLSPQQLLQRLQTHVNDAKTHSEWTQEALTNAQLELKGGKQELDERRIAEMERHNRAMEAKPTAITIAQQASGGGNFDPTQPLDPALEAQAKHTAETGQRLTPSSRNPNAWKTNARADFLAQQKGQTVGEAGQSYKASAKGKLDFEPAGVSGKTISAINTMTEHLASARRIVEEMNNGNIPAANKLAQTLGFQIGGTRATQFNTLKQFLAGEVAKVATGGHLTQAEIHEAGSKLDSAQTPQQLFKVLDTMREVAAGKLIALDQDHKRLFGKSLSEANRLTPATKEAFKSVNAAHGGEAKKYQGAASVDDLLKALGH